MSEKRPKTHSALLRNGDSESQLVELFDSLLWEKRGGTAGSWRVRINDKWLCNNGKYSFLSLRAVGELLVSLLLGAEPQGGEEKPPYLPYRAEVRVRHGDAHVHGERGWVHAEPHREIDGRWYAWIWICGKPRKFPAEAVTLIRVR